MGYYEDLRKERELENNGYNYNSQIKEFVNKDDDRKRIALKEFNKMSYKDTQNTK